MIYPLIQEIPYRDAASTFAFFASTEGAIFLDSAELRTGCGRYSFIGVYPFLTFLSKNGYLEWDEKISLGNSLSELKKKLALFPLSTHPNLPPFQGGVAGFFSYDLCHELEKIASNQEDDMQFADVIVCFYDLVIAFDHELERTWIFSSGYPSLAEKREQHAEERLSFILKKLENTDKKESVFVPIDEKNIISNFTQTNYEKAVEKVKNYILAGDIFEANISQRFLAHVGENNSPFDLYRRLRHRNPAPFAAYFNCRETIIASASPERFLKLTENQVETRPIKGTRPRGKTHFKDLQLAADLKNSEKDHAENVMIVDLLRNDLSRVCEDYSVQVSKLCALESYQSVHHLVSVVKGQLKQNYTAIDLLQVTFPGGSITGAPKIRAMEIIAEIEPTKRGPYCGSLGYIGFDGNMDTSILIRTFAIKNNKITFQAGGAIVMDSCGLSEYEETLTKANALRRALSDDFTDR